MMQSLRIVLLIGACSLTSIAHATDEWLRFRGPDGSGKVDGPAIPFEWSATKNLRWKSPLPGKGSSSPVVTGNHVFVTAYTGYGLDMAEPGEINQLVRHLVAIDRVTGKELWRSSVDATDKEDPYSGFITQHGYASSTPATDGERVFALLGKSGLFAYDFEGKELWHVDLGQKSDPAKWGDATSPIVVGDLVIVDAGILGNKFLGINKATGKIEWTIEDSAFTNCWATPTPIHNGETTQVLFHVPNKVLAVDPATGKELWTVPSPLNDATCGSIVAQAGKAFLMGSRAGHGLAFDCSPSSPEDRVLWTRQLRSGISTPLIVGDQMYWSTGGVFYSASLETGEYVYKERLPRLGGPTGGFPNSDYSSPVAIGENIILFTRSGESYVIRPGEKFELLAHNAAFDGDTSAFSATPALSNGELFVRSESYLYCIGEAP